MRIRLLAVGTRMPRWVEQGFAEYAGRMPPECRLDLQEIPVAPRGRNADVARLRAAEGERLLKALGPRDQVVALDERGAAWSTIELSRHLARWLQQGGDLCLLVGGPDGLAPEVLARAGARWSLSPLTLPHALVRVLAAEALYRAWSVLANHPYHRA